MQVYPGLPAAEAGMRGAWRNARGEVVLGDIITAIDGKPIRNHDDYYSAMEARAPGDLIRVETLRGKDRHLYKLRLVESQ